MREGVRHGAGHGTGEVAGMTDGLDGLIGHNGLIRLNGQTRHNGRYVARTISLISRGKAYNTPRAGRTRKWCGNYRFAKRAISHDEMGRFRE